jgi:hypothetical protein
MNEKSTTFSVGPLELLMSLKAKPVEFVHYGDTPLGLRMDVHFEGALEGGVISGTMRGVDYVLVRSDGVGELNVRAVIVTNDGANISVQISGYQCNQELRDNQVKLLTGDERYLWLNDKLIVGKGMASADGLEVDYFYEP